MIYWYYIAKKNWYKSQKNTELIDFITWEKIL